MAVCGSGSSSAGMARIQLCGRGCGGRGLPVLVQAEGIETTSVPCLSTSLLTF